MHLDWYQATIPAPAIAIRTALMDAKLAHSYEDQDRGGRGYKSSVRFMDEDLDSHLILFHGSTSANPSLQASGEAAEPVSAFIRKTWPQHAVSRVDLAQDFSEEGGFERKRRALARITKANAVNSGWSYIPRQPEKGRTFYCGSPTSAAMARLYEKGRELLAKGKVTADQFDPHHFRLEFQLRPNKSVEKALFSGLEPRAMLGYSVWVTEAAKALCNVEEVEKINRLSHEAAEIDQAFAHLVSQYQGTLRRKAEADNNRHVGLVKPSNEELLSILMDRLQPALLEAWENQDRARKERDPIREFRAAMSQKVAKPFTN